MMSTRRNGDMQECIKEIVHSYLKRRNFWVELGEVEPVTESLGELAADSLADAATGSVSKAMVYTVNQMEPAVADAQFARFRDWVQESPEPYQAALQQLLCPVFVSLHMELVLSGHNPARFYGRHHGALLYDPQHQALVTELAGVSTADQLQRASLKRFRCSPPELTLSSECSEYLRRSLRSCQMTLILHVLSQHLRLDVATVQPAAEAEHGRQGRRRYVPGPADSAQYRPTISTEAGGALAHAASLLRAQPPSAPTVCSYRVRRPLACAALSPQLEMLAAGGDYGVIVWTLTANRLSTRSSAASRVPLADGGCGLLTADGGGESCRPLRAHAGPVFDMLFVPSGTLLLTAGEDTTVRAWHTNGWDNVSIYRGHSYPVWSVDCQPRPAGAYGHYFVTGSMDRTARLWSYDRTHQLRIFTGHTQDVDCVAMHPNGNYLCSASADATVRLWSHADAAQARVFSGHRGIIHAMRFSPDGKLLAAAGEDHHVRVHDLGGGGVVAELAGHLAPISCLLWTADSRTLISADRDGSINMWNLVSDGADVAAPAFRFCSPGSATVGLEQAPHNYLVAVFGDLEC